MEIANRYYYQRGKILSMLNDDPDLDEAIATIANQEKFLAILSGKYVQPKPEITIPDEEEMEEENPMN